MAYQSNNPFFVAPADYSQGLATLSQGMQNYGQMQQQKQEKQQQQELQQQQQQQIQGLQEVAASGDKAAVAQYLAENPTIAKNVQDTVYNSMGVTDDIQKEALRNDTFQIIANPQSTEQVLTNRIESIKARGGDPAHTMKELETFQQNPEAYVDQVEGFAVGAFPNEYQKYNTIKRNKEKDLFEQRKYRDERADKAAGKTDVTDTTSQKDFKYYQDLKKTDPEAAAQYGQQKGYVAKTGKDISVFQQKNLDTAQTASIEANNAANSYDDLATQYKDNAGNLGGGIFGSWKDGLKTATGNEDAASMLRRDWIKIKNSEVIQNLPPGAASETDVAIIMKGYPGDNAKPEEVSNFLGSMAKVKKAEAMYNEFKSKYISDKGDTRGMLDAWKDNVKQGNIDNNKNQYPNAPDIGVVQDGYKYKGGDPKSPKSWESQ